MAVTAIPRRRRRTGAETAGAAADPGWAASDTPSPVGVASARTTLVLTVALLLFAAGSAVLILTR